MTSTNTVKTFAQYCKAAGSTAIYPRRAEGVMYLNDNPDAAVWRDGAKVEVSIGDASRALSYVTLGLVNEIQELKDKLVVCETVKEINAHGIKELGDVLWYFAELCSLLGIVRPLPNIGESVHISPEHLNHVHEWSYWNNIHARDSLVRDVQQIACECIKAGTSFIVPYSRNRSTAIETADNLASHAGFVAGRVKKFLRGDYGAEKLRFDIAENIKSIYALIGDLSAMMSCTLEEVANINVSRLAKRKDEGKIQGDGDNR